MGGCRITISFAVNCGKVHLKANVLQVHPLLACAPVVFSRRHAHMQPLTKNLQYISKEKIRISADPKTMKLNKAPDKPICIMLNWLLAPRKHVLKYADIYLDEGYDVVSVNIRPWQLMWPTKGAQVIGWDILRLLAENKSTYVVHGFSVGGYVWSEALVHAAKDLSKYQPVLDRVSAQVWDSVADITAVTEGVPLALLPHSRILQKLFKAALELYLAAFYSVATRHYQRASDTYYASPCRAPALFLVSRADRVGAERNARAAVRAWRALPVQCTWKCWENSPHVSHYMTHRDEYLSLLQTHLRNNALAANVTTDAKLKDDAKQPYTELERMRSTV